MKIGSGASGGKLLDQLDWIKSMTNVTGVLHILIGTYELLNFRNLSGQASRRGLDLHFPRYWNDLNDCTYACCGDNSSCRGCPATCQKAEEKAFGSVNY
jgi:hypothetical protein